MDKQIKFVAYAVATGFALGTVAFIYLSGREAIENKRYKDESEERRSAERLDGRYLADHSEECPLPFQIKAKKC